MRMPGTVVECPGQNSGHSTDWQSDERIACGIRAERPLEEATFAAVRRRAILEGCKWDPQVGDVATLSPFPLVMESQVWNGLARQAELLAAEAISAETEISCRPELIRELGFPRALRKVVSEKGPVTPAAGRVVRFDFHPTAEGWLISEANSDVPGGFSEASHFTALMAEHFPLLRPAGNPAGVWADALAAAALPATPASYGRFCEAGSRRRDAGAPGGVIALLSAPGYMEDHQVIAFLAARLRERECRPYLATPRQLAWRDGVAHLESAWYRGRVDALVRFYQAEWLAQLNGRCSWRCFFRDGKTPVANPGLAAITESKRFPLLWERLSTPLTTWRSLLPETREPGHAPWERDDGWLLKTALCNTGDTVCVRELLGEREWSRARRAARWASSGWVAQRRFESVPISTPVGPRHVCLGVYTVNGRAAGVYARLAVKPVIDFAAVDAALLLEDHG